MHIGYCSPFSPCQSGIADFSEELVVGLQGKVELTLFSSQRPENEKIQHIPWRPISDLDRNEIRQKLDLIVYHVGNNAEYHNDIVDMLFKYPGILELHDVGVHNLMAARTIGRGDVDGYVEAVRYCHGQEGISAISPFLQGQGDMPWEKYGLEMPMNRQLLDAAQGLIVHSDLARQIVRGYCPDKAVAVIPLHSELQEGSAEEYQHACRMELNLPADKLIIGSFGLATADKQIPQIVEALKRFKESYGDGFLYCVVGAVHKDLGLEEQIKALGLQKQVRITGFVDLADFVKYIGACDFCLNLRYPTRGESSASLHRMLGMGKPIIATDIGTFMEYPDEIVLKVSYDEHEIEQINQALLTLAKDREELRKRSAAAQAYVNENCSLEKNIARYLDFFNRMHTGSWEKDWADHMVDLLLELGLTNPEFTAHVSSFCEGI